jgi:hypothetical protein
MFAERLYVMRKNFKILSEKSKKRPNPKKQNNKERNNNKAECVGNRTNKRLRKTQCARAMVSTGILDG